MILECPECLVRYLVSSAAIGESGRRVRCAHCGHEWFQGSVTEDRAEVEASSSSFDEVLAERMEVDFADTDDARADIHEIPDAVKPMHENLGLPALPEEEPPPDGEALAAGYGAAACLFLLAIGLLVLFRGPVYAAWPATALLYDLVGADLEIPGEGLIIDRVTAKAEPGPHGADNLVLRGSVINLLESETAVPPIRASLRAADGTVKESWLIDPPVTTLAGEAAAEFEGTYAALPGEAESVHLSFVISDAPPKPEPEEKPAEEDSHHGEAEPDHHEPAQETHHEEPAHHAPAPEAHHAPAHH